MTIIPESLPHLRFEITREYALTALRDFDGLRSGQYRALAVPKCLQQSGWSRPAVS
jgi:hypothetical protein